MKVVFAISLLMLLLGTAALAAPMDEEQVDDINEEPMEAELDDSVDDDQADDADDVDDVDEKRSPVIFVPRAVNDEYVDDVDEKRSPMMVGMANPCYGRTTVSKRIAGKQISQTFHKQFTANGCQWVLPGSTRNRFTLKDSCVRCRADGSNVRCMGAPLAYQPGCDAVHGPDCKLYFSAKGNPSEPCNN